jgi:hypothetical protein
VKSFLWTAGYILAGALLLYRVWFWYLAGAEVDVESEYARQRLYMWGAAFVVYLLLVPAIQAWRIRNA